MEQFERVGRYLTRLCYAYEGIQASSATFSIQDPKDDCISYFMHCYHLKDWLIASYGNRKEIEDFINANEELRICADICNGAKHLRITNGLRSGSNQRIEASGLESSLWITGSGGVEVHKCEFTVVSEHKTYDALQLAKRCMELWKSFVSTIQA
jgi:hypothetical protein